MMRSPSKSGGFALLEVMVSVLILAFGLIGLAGLQARAISLSSDAQDRNHAALLANELASAMWVAGAPTVDTATLAAWQAKVQGALPAGQGVYASVPADNSASISITWKAPTRPTAEAPSHYETRVVMP